MATAATQTCYRHPDRETGVACSSCGRPICPDCMTPTPVGMRCPECSRQKTQVRTARSMHTGVVVVTQAVIALSVIAFLGELLTDGSRNGAFERGALYAPFVADGDWWRVVTSGFLHAQGAFGFVHIGLNMYLLYLIGQLFEGTIGSARFAGIYLVAIVGGAVGAMYADPLAPTVGASGGVFGLMGAVVLFERSRGLNPFQTAIGQTLMLNLALNFFFAFGNSRISVGGHVGGLAAGALAMLAVLALERAKAPRWAAYPVLAVLFVAFYALALVVADVRTS